MTELNELKKFAKLLADESGKIIRQYFRTKMKIDSKADESPVTIADRKAEEIMREIIMKEFPGHGIKGEEFGEHNPDSDYLWTLDPVDGTKSFVAGAHSFGTCIGLLYKNEPILGVINQPVLNEFMIGDNSVTTLNGEQVHVSEVNELSNAVLCTTDHINIEIFRDIKPFESLIRKVKLYRMWGDCYGYLLLSAGYIDIMIDPELSIWETAACTPVVRGAGGIVTDYHGGNPMNNDGFIAANSYLHGQVLKILNE